MIMSNEPIVITKKSTTERFFLSILRPRLFLWSILVPDVLPVLAKRRKMSHLVQWCIMLNLSKSFMSWMKLLKMEPRGGS